MSGESIERLHDELLSLKGTLDNIQYVYSTFDLSCATPDMVKCGAKACSKRLDNHICEIEDILDEVHSDIDDEIEEDIRDTLSSVRWMSIKIRLGGNIYSIADRTVSTVTTVVSMPL